MGRFAQASAAFGRPTGSRFLSAASSGSRLGLPELQQQADELGGLQQQLGAPEIEPDRPGVFRTLVDILSRPNFAIAGFAEEILGQTPSVTRGVQRSLTEIFSGVGGIRGKKRAFGEVMENLGVGTTTLADAFPALEGTWVGNFGSRGAAGLAADIFTDPLTYVGLGAASTAIRKTLTIGGKKTSVVLSAAGQSRRNALAETLLGQADEGIEMGFGRAVPSSRLRTSGAPAQPSALAKREIASLQRLESAGGLGADGRIRLSRLLRDQELGEIRKVTQGVTASRLARKMFPDAATSRRGATEEFTRGRSGQIFEREIDRRLGVLKVSEGGIIDDLTGKVGKEFVDSAAVRFKVPFVDDFVLLEKGRVGKFFAPVGSAARALPFGEEALAGAGVVGDTLRAATNRMFHPFNELGNLPVVDRVPAMSLKRDMFNASGVHKMHLLGRGKPIAREFEKLQKADADIGKKFYSIREGKPIAEVVNGELKIGKQYRIADLTDAQRANYDEFVNLYDNMGNTGVTHGVLDPTDVRSGFFHHGYTKESRVALREYHNAPGSLPLTGATREQFTKVRAFDTFFDSVTTSFNKNKQALRQSAVGQNPLKYPVLIPEYDMSKNLARYIHMHSEAVARQAWREEAVLRFGAKVDGFDVNSLWDVSRPATDSVPTLQKVQRIFDRVKPQSKLFRELWEQEDTFVRSGGLEQTVRGGGPRANSIRAGIVALDNVGRVKGVRGSQLDVLTGEVDRELTRGASITVDIPTGGVQRTLEPGAGTRVDVPLGRGGEREATRGTPKRFAAPTGAVDPETGKPVLQSVTAPGRPRFGGRPPEETQSVAVPGRPRPTGSQTPITQRVGVAGRPRSPGQPKPVTRNVVTGGRLSVRGKAGFSGKNATIGRELAQKIRAGGELSPADFLEARRIVKEQSEQVRQMIGDFDIAMGPTIKRTEAEQRVIARLVREMPKLDADGKRELIRQVFMRSRSSDQMVSILDKLEDYSEFFPRSLADNVGDVEAPIAKRLGEEAGQMVPVKSIWTGGESYLMPRVIRDDLYNMNSRLLHETDFKEASKMMRGWDRATNLFKLGNYTLWPASATRDMYSNVGLSLLDIGLQALNPAYHASAIKMMGAGESRALMRRFGDDILPGTSMTIRESVDEAKRQGIWVPGEVFAELAGDPTTANKALKKVAHYRGLIENEARVVLWHANMRRGMSSRDAADHVAEFLFNYGEVSDIERRYFRRLIPFYTFTRKNVELQWKALRRNPGMSINQLKPFRGRNSENEQMVSFEAEALKLRLDKDGRSILSLTGIDLPLRNLDTVWAGSFRETGRRIAGMFNPLLKVPVEAIQGREFFNGRDVSRQHFQKMGQFVDAMGTPKALKDWMGYKKEVNEAGKPKYTFDSLSPPILFTKAWMFSRVMSTSNRTWREYGDDPSSGRMWLDFLTGLRVKDLDLDEQQRRRLQERIRGLQDSLVRRGAMRTFTRPFTPRDQTGVEFQ